MTEVFVYVEGPSDQMSMRELFRDAIETAKMRGNIVDFSPMNGKEPLLVHGPTKAINILRNRPNSYVFLVPDLYPMNKPFPHTTFTEMKGFLLEIFVKELQQKKVDNRIVNRFFVHCFKYDLEALILASEKALLARLAKTQITQSWTKPAENQNHHKPPKRIGETLFREVGQKYKDTADAPWILRRSSWKELTEQWAQNFKPFVADLFAVLGMDFP